MASRFLLSLVQAADRHPAPHSLKVLAGSAVLISLGAYSVLRAPSTKPGNDLASSEKPQQLRGEKSRTLEGEKAALGRAAAR